MVCLVTAAAEKRSRAPPGNIAYNYVHRREDTHALWMRYAHTPLRTYPPVNHVTGLVNSANDLRRCAPRRLSNLFFSFLIPISFLRLHFCITTEIHKEKKNLKCIIRVNYRILLIYNLFIYYYLYIIKIIYVIVYYFINALIDYFNNRNLKEKLR